jgi:hypothetical protein
MCASFSNAMHPRTLLSFSRAMYKQGRLSPKTRKARPPPSRHKARQEQEQHNNTTRQDRTRHTHTHTQEHKTSNTHEHKTSNTTRHDKDERRGEETRQRKKKKNDLCWDESKYKRNCLVVGPIGNKKNVSFFDQFINNNGNGL